MGAIQNAVHGALGAATIAGGLKKHFNEQDEATAKQAEANKLKAEEMQKAEDLEVNKATTKLEDMALRKMGYEDQDIKSYQGYQSGILEPSGEKGKEILKKFDSMKADLANTVYTSEVMGKMRVDAAFRQRILDLDPEAFGKPQTETEKLIDYPELKLKGGKH